MFINQGSCCMHLCAIAAPPVACFSALLFGMTLPPLSFHPESCTSRFDAPIACMPVCVNTGLISAMLGPWAWHRPTRAKQPGLANAIGPSALPVIVACHHLCMLLPPYNAIQWSLLLHLSMFVCFPARGALTLAVVLALFLLAGPCAERDI